METEQIRITRKTIIGCTAAALGMDVAEVIGPGRFRHQVQARWACVILIREFYPNISRPQLGEVLGDRDHSTMLHAIRSSEKAMRTDPEFAVLVAKCRERVRAWRPTTPQTVVLAPGRAEVTPELRSPPAREFEAPEAIPVKPLIRQRATRYGTEYSEGGMDLQWWSANDRRFRAAMRRAHPERCPASMLEAAE